MSIVSPSTRGVLKTTKKGYAKGYTNVALLAVVAEHGQKEGNKNEKDFTNNPQMPRGQPAHGSFEDDNGKTRAVWAVQNEE